MPPLCSPGRRPARARTVLFGLPALLMVAVATLLPGDPGAAQTVVFINEIHYDNADADVDEGVEVAGPAGTDLAGHSIRLYNGSDGGTYGSIVHLSGLIPDQEAGFGTLWFPIAGLQNGAPDGLALIDPSGVVVQFLSYEGTLTATGGPAAGMESEDIGVSEAGTEPPGQSLQLAGTGSAYEDFVWDGPMAESRGSVNPNQDFRGGAPPSLPAISIDDVSIPEGDSGTSEALFTVTLSEPGSAEVSVDFAVSDGTATTPDDHVATSGTLIFAPGDVSGQIAVAVNGDTVDEPDETFTVDLANPVNAVLADAQGLGTILDDDEGTPPVECTIVGTEGDDVVNGTAGDDVICALGGHDRARGGGGDDLILGGAGDDRLAGGVGDDLVRGEAGSDRLVGGAGADALDGGEDDDFLGSRDGIPGNDAVDGGPGGDRCLVDPGDAVVGCE